ncbi:Mitochondrial carrier [Fusarium albosuccineum]|uniref:Mitochondrial carrier n=1 Tax=Fusarium albosuccineum TaxID=1237068 RepID=A0A8H4L6W7_9HYPO|nr:Mitochondrial carrier [Fusarium albosuccineum]
MASITAEQAHGPSYQDDVKSQKKTSSSGHNYKGFIAGSLSGVAKVTVGHPFDTIKVRLQTTNSSHFTGPMHCVRQTIRHEGLGALYKGFTPPLIGWMFMDSILLGSFNVYRQHLKQREFFSSREVNSCFAHGVAGGLAGWTVSFIAAPVEHIKARLQIHHPHLSKLLSIFWAIYDVVNRRLHEHTQLSTPLINFLAGGVSAQAYWLAGYPTDVVKQRIMTDPMGGGSGDGQRRFWRWRDEAKAVYTESGWRGFWRGFAPCFLRAFPANAMAVMTFEGAMRAMSTVDDDSSARTL